VVIFKPIQPLCIQNQLVYQNGLPASRNQRVKTDGAGCRASRELCLRDAGKKANLGSGYKFTFLLQNEHLNLLSSEILVSAANKDEHLNIKIQRNPPKPKA
jgi:hypothetical protein